MSHFINDSHTSEFARNIHNKIPRTRENQVKANLNDATYAICDLVAELETNFEGIDCAGAKDVFFTACCFAATYLDQSLSNASNEGLLVGVASVLASCKACDPSSLRTRSIFIKKAICLCGDRVVKSLEGQCGFKAFKFTNKQVEEELWPKVLEKERILLEKLGFPSKVCFGGEQLIYCLNTIFSEFEELLPLKDELSKKSEFFLKNLFGSFAVVDFAVGIVVLTSVMLGTRVIAGEKVANAVLIAIIMRDHDDRMKQQGLLPSTSVGSPSSSASTFADVSLDETTCIHRLPLECQSIVNAVYLCIELYVAWVLDQ